MSAITEDYVSFETAKLLKDKWFNEPCLYYYFSDGIIGRRKGLKDRNCPSVNTFSMPTHQMAIKWLREIQNLFVFPFPQVNTNKFWVEIYQLSDNQEWENLYCESIDLQDYPTYEKACEAAIKYCLENLI